MTVDTILLAVGTGDAGRVERTVDAVLDVAAPLDATVVVAHVLPEDDDGVPTNSPPLVGAHFPYVLSNDEYDDLLDDYPLDEYAVDDVVANQETVRAVVDRLADAGVDHEVRGAVGEPSEGVVALATDVDADRVVVSGRRRSPTGKVVFGSVVQSVLLDSPCPVTFVRDD